MKISNVTILSTNLTNNTAKISFTISEATENVNIYLKINDEEYKKIFSNKTNETLEYTANVSRGVNNLLLKATDSTIEYITEPIQALLKETPSIKNLKCSYSDSTGKYILNFAFNGDVNFKYNIYLKLDTNDYIEVLSNQISGDKTIEQTSTRGEHTCILKVSDGYNDYTFSPFQFEITNHKPILSKVLVTDITNNGEAYIHYSTKDIESSTLTHKLVIGTTQKVITPTRVNNFYSYKITGLSKGTSNCKISISDGIDTISSDVFSIEVFSDTTNKKELLRRAKIRYDSAYQQLRDIIVSVTSDLKYDYDIENALIAKAQDNYKIEYSNFNKISQQSIDTIGTNKVNVTKQELQSEINDVDSAVNGLETTMWGVFQDGVLDQSERDTLRSSLDLVAKEKSDIDRDYEALYNNEDLVDPSKTNLRTAYNNFCTVHTTLVTTINNLVNKETIIDNKDKTNLRTAFDNWRNGLGNYRTASLEAIDSIAKKKADDSADVVDKKWAEIILDPETGIQMQVGNLTNKVNNVDNKIKTTVKSVNIMYYLSTSTTELSGGTWTDVAPTWEANKYMWSKTVTTLSDGTIKESSPTCIAGAKGQDGVPGTNGKTTYTWIKYADDENGNGISNDPTNKSYIGFAYNKTTNIESNSPSDYTWSLIKGADGADGQDGKDGVTTYTWVKYSNNADGTGLYDTPNSQTKYIGIATNKTTATESTNKTDYVWSLFRGEDGIPGTDGIGINNIVEEYYLSTSKETQEGGKWVETPPTWEVGKYMWTRSRIEYSNGTVEYTTPICDSSWEAIDEIDIGGRNLIINSDVLNSQFSPIGAYKGTRTVVDDAEAKSKKHLEFKCTTAGNGFHTSIFPKTSDKVGKTYTWSFWAKCSVNKSGTVGHECGGQKTINLTTEWQKFTHTWKFIDAAYSSFTWYLSWNVDEILYIRDFKIEEGNKATDWTPAPEDVQSQINTTIERIAKIEIDSDSINSTVSSIQSSVNGLDQRVTNVEITANGINSTVSSMQSTVNGLNDRVDGAESSVNGLNNRVAKAESNITQLSNKITSSVMTESDIKSIIEQNPSSVKIGFNGISDNVVIDSSGLTVNQGAIACDLLTVPDGHHPIIKLFPTVDASNSSGYCSIDATQKFEQGQGTAIRLKWDNMNYVRVARSSISFYLEPRENLTAFVFQSDYGEYDASDYESRIATPYGTLSFRGNNDPGLFYYTKESNCGRKLLTTYDMSDSVTSSSSINVASSAAVKAAYDKANHSHTHSHSGEYAPSSHPHSSISSGSSTSIDCYSSTMYMTAGSTIYVSDCDIVGENGSENCGTYSKPWRSVVADMLIYLSYCGKADGDEENLTDANVSYNFMKQYSNIISSKQQLNQTKFILNTEEQNEIFEEEDEMQKAVVEKANAIYEYDEEGINLFTNASVLTETMAQTIEILINKVEELEKTVLDLQNKLGE